MSTTMEKPVKTTKAAAPERAKATGAKIAVPFSKTAKYAQRDIHMRLPQEEATTLRAVFEALEESHATLEDGKAVDSPQLALRWLLQEVGRAAR
jgi:hypothetical protein